MKIDKHIEIVRCGIPRFSSMGLKSCNMIKETLARHYRSVGISYVSNETDLATLIAKKPDLALLGFKNLPTDTTSDKNQTKLWVSDALEAAGINFSGSTRPAIELDHNKDEAKRVVAAAGLLTAPFFTAVPGEYTSLYSLPLQFPLFVKPPEEGGGTGIDDNSIVRDFSAFNRKVQEIYQTFGTPALVERYLDGREFSVALLETNVASELLALPIELITKPNSHGDRLLSRKVKSDDSEHVMRVIPGRVRDQIITLASDAFRALGARDYGRIDIRMDERGKPHFLEANLIPGLAQHDFTSYFTSACLINLHMDYESMLLHIVELGLRRSKPIFNEVIVPNPLLLTSPPLIKAFEHGY